MGGGRVGGHKSQRADWGATLCWAVGLAPGLSVSSGVTGFVKGTFSAGGGVVTGVIMEDFQGLTWRQWEEPQGYS